MTADRVAYYPGCSLEATGKEYDLSTRAVCAALGLELAELEDWSCCGATSAHNLDHLLSVALPARNIALAQGMGLDLAVPCAACYSRLKKADYLLQSDANMRKHIEDTAEFKYQGSSKVMSLVETLISMVGLERIAGKVTRQLNGLPVVCYYGCLLVRPPEVAGFDRVEHPMVIDQLMEALGARPLTWSYKTECCGASLVLTNANVVKGLVGRIVEAAREAGATAIVTACPLCQSNLEMRQPKNKQAVPALYFTELMGLAMGLDGAAGWLNKHLIEPVNLLNQISVGC